MLAGISRPAIAEAPVWDLGRWIDVGLQNSPATRSAWARARAAREAVGEARSAYYPDIIAEFRGGADRWYTPAATAPDNFNRLQATVALGVEYLLLDFGRRDADVDETLSLFEAAGWSARREMQQVVFGIQSAFFRQEAAARRFDAARLRLRFARLLDEQIRQEAATGLRAKPDVREAAAKVRKCLYMAAHTAASCNPVISAYVQGLRDRGKPYKCAIVAAMRKLLIHIQSLMKHAQLSPC